MKSASVRLRKIKVRPDRCAYNALGPGWNRTANLHEGLGAPEGNVSRPDSVGKRFSWAGTRPEHDGPLLAYWYSPSLAKPQPHQALQFVRIAIFMGIMVLALGQALAAGRVQEFLTKAQPGDLLQG